MLKVDDIRLYCLELNRMSQFVAFIFDIMPVMNEDGSISFDLPQMTLTLEASPWKNISKRSHFRLKVEDISELEELQKKVEFFCYKNSVTYKPALRDATQLCFYDPDGREWVARLKPRLTHKVDKPDQDVRYC